MRYKQQALRAMVVLALAAGLLSSCGFRRKKYDNPIAKDTQQPDKILFDKAIKDIERSRFEVARLTLQTLINTYDSSEFMAKAKLAIADSWFREGGSHGLAQAEAEYKDFILFYPTMEEAAEAQEKVCGIHYRQMEKADRDKTHSIRAEEECRQLLTQFPNSKFAPRVQQMLREIQEVRADGEYRTGAFYHTKGSYPAAANRLQALVDQFPLFSGADEALWELGDSYSRMGGRFRDKTVAAYTRIVKDYPLSPRVEDAKLKLQGLEAPVPEADPVAMARMKYELENREKTGMMGHFWGMFRRGPDVSQAAKSGSPPMNLYQPTIPASVPPPAAATGATGVTADVSVSTVTDSTALDSKPDARMNPPKPEDQQKAPDSQAQPQSQQPGGQPAQAQTQSQQPGGQPAQAQTQQPGSPAVTQAVASDGSALPTNHAAVKPKKEKKPKNKK